MYNDISKIELSEIITNSVNSITNSFSLLCADLDAAIEKGEANRCADYATLLQVRHDCARINNNFMQLISLLLHSKDQYTVDFAENHVDELFDGFVFENEKLLKERGIEVEVDCPPDLIWFFDRNMVSNVVNNILNNAMKYSKRKLSLSASVENEYLKIQIDDDSAGYPADMIVSTLEDHDMTNFKISNTGLGIYFAAIISHLHRNKGRQGYIATSNEGIAGGSRFTIFLP